MEGRQQKRPPCGFPGCSDRHNAVRLQLIPAGNSKPVHEGAICFHRKKKECAAYFGYVDAQPQPAAKRQAGVSRIPVGALVSEEPCPCRIGEIDQVWGVRYCDISDMGPEEKGNALGERRIIEYCVHGHFYRSPTDQKGVHGAWWIPLRKLVKRVGRDRVEPKIAEFEEDMKSRSRSEMESADVSDSSEDEVGTEMGG